MKRFLWEHLPSEELNKLEHLSQVCKGDILTMTTLAGSGHPGGSMSSLDIYLTVYSYAYIKPPLVDAADRDRIVISHGHTSPGVYSVLGRLGFFDIEAAIATFRLAGSIFDGHVVRKVPGIEWGSGNLGQGLSAGCGFALAARIKGQDTHVFVLMSDGEQTKGQVGEARRFAVKYGLNNLTVVVDYNRIQISGATERVMPCSICANYKSDGWEVKEVDGHNFAAVYTALRSSLYSSKPVCLVAKTVIGHGVSFMENKHQYHGKALSLEEYQRAMEELKLEPCLEKYRQLRAKKWVFPERVFPWNISVNQGSRRVYSEKEKTDNRTAYGQALADLARANRENPAARFVVVDCDLASSVKTDLFEKEFPEHFFQVGVQEHHAATLAGVLSVENLVCFFSDFGVFGVDETFNQQRLNDCNSTNLKLVCTHLGLDVGEDGKTHQCIDYLGLLRNLFGFKVVIPADPNQTDAVIRYVAKEPGNFFVGMGRSKIPIVTDESGQPFFGENYQFTYGQADILRKGEKAWLFTMGAMVPRALQVDDLLTADGIKITIVNCACPLVVDNELMKKAMEHGLIVTYEDHHQDTGLGATVALFLAEHRYTGTFLRLGISHYGSSGTPEALFASQGLDPATVAVRIKENLR
ncbi:MAG: transketolase [Candidatus Omnitrophica bacterium]|nr:transketolase [Candidatus Omnitrophota bacterium]